MNIRESITITLVAGLLWGGILLAWAVGARVLLGGWVTGLEKGVVADVMPFAVGGVVMAGLCWSLLMAVGERIPFVGSIPKAIAITLGVWFFLVGTAQLSGVVVSHRVYANGLEIVQGAGLVAILGVILGVLRERYGEISLWLKSAVAGDESE